MITNQVLHSEQQLGVQLNKSITNEKRSNFALLLAMLSPDALDFAQFHLPKSSPHQVDHIESSAQQLRSQLGVVSQRPLAPKEFNIRIGENNAKLLQQQGLAAIKLADCLTPEPLTIRDNKEHIPFCVLDNCSPLTQHKHTTKETEFNDPQINAGAFYEQLKTQASSGQLLMSA